MAATESIPEQILENVKTQLAAIREGDDYHYTPDAVVRVDHFVEGDLDTSTGTVVYLVRNTGDERQSANAAEFGKNARDFDVPVLVAYKDTRDGTNPHKASDPISGTIRNRMIRDVTKKLLADESRGGLAIETNVLEALREFDIAGWIVGMVPSVVLYHYDRTAP